MKHYLLKDADGKSEAVYILHLIDENDDVNKLAARSNRVVVRELMFAEIPQDRKYRHAWRYVGDCLVVSPKVIKSFMLEKLSQAQAKHFELINMLSLGAYIRGENDKSAALDKQLVELEKVADPIKDIDVDDEDCAWDELVAKLDAAYGDIKWL
jgi:hypothetical protein